MLINKLITIHNKKYSTYYKGSLYSHTPMALISLKEMGASDERIDEFFIIDTKKLVPIVESSVQIDETNWKDNLGKQELEFSYKIFFANELIGLGIDECLKKYFSFLMKGVGAAAFHPIIRLSYGFKIKNKDEVASSLASWATSFLDLGIDASLSDELSMLSVLNEVMNSDFKKNFSETKGNIADRMLTVSRTNEYKEFVSKVFIKELEKDKLEESLLWLFAQTNDFTLLHAVTSHHAYESLKKYSNNENESRVYLWKAILAAYLSILDSTELDLNWTYPLVDLPAWSELKALAIKSNDNHVIKLVHTLSTKENIKLDEQLRFAAAQKLGLKMEVSLNLLKENTEEREF
ncbi:MAG: hypothetical protein ACI9QD_000981 [Thermoproteota archaeon]|jgi:hypothetical protein